jgi:hypothetical protein
MELKENSTPKVNFVNIKRMHESIFLGSRNGNLFGEKNFFLDYSSTFL